MKLCSKFALALLLALPGLAHAQLTCSTGYTGQSAVTVKASNLLDGGAAANGAIYFKPVLATGGSASYQLPAGGTATITPYCATVLTSAQTAYPALPPAPDMMSMWNTLVEASIAGGHTPTVTTLTDASTITWNATDPNLDGANLLLFTGTAGSQTPSANTSRTINLTGMVSGARYMLAITPFPLSSAAGDQAVTMGSGCTWQWSIGNVPMNGNGFTIPAWAHYSFLVVWGYDGTNCNATVVD